MRSTLRLIVAAPAVLFIGLTGCLATQSQLHHASVQQDSMLKVERAARLVADAELAASDSALRAELGNVRGDVRALRTELQNMRTEFNAKITAMEDGLKFMMPVNFAYDQSAVRDQDRASLERFAKIVQKYYPGSRVTIEGCADPAGSVRYNLALSARRADAVKSYLTSQGVEPMQLSTIGYGKARLVAPGASGDQPGAELNRRVVFVIETKSEKAIAMREPESR